MSYQKEGLAISCILMIDIINLCVIDMQLMLVENQLKPAHTDRSQSTDMHVFLFFFFLLTRIRIWS